MARNKRNKMMAKLNKCNDVVSKTWTNPRNGETRIYISGLFDSSDKFFLSEEKDGSVKMAIIKSFGRADTTDEMMAGDTLGDILKEAKVEDDWNALVSAITDQGGKITIKGGA